MNQLFNKEKHVLKYKLIDSYYNVQYASIEIRIYFSIPIQNKNKSFR